LPSDAVLLHIGPHKTGTTAIQGAFHEAREQLAAHGVRYAGETRQPWLAAVAATKRPGRRGDGISGDLRWEALVAEVTGATSQRVVVSSEAFTDADKPAARRIVEALGGPRVHVVVTLRPLAKIAPSQWQQLIRNGSVEVYRHWLHKILDVDPATSKQRFWKRHAHDRLVARWASVVGPERVTVIAVSDRDRLMLMRSFEQLLALPTGVLVPEAEVVNRSLTRGEVATIRLMNRRFRKNRWPDRVYGQLVRNGVLATWRDTPPAKAERPMSTPRWAVKRFAAIGAAAAEAITASGVNIIGDITLLGRLPKRRKGPPPGPPLLAPKTVAAAFTAMIAASETVVWPVPSSSEVPIQNRPVGSVRSRVLLGHLAGRVKRRLARALHVPGQH
jgi:hypothetical protein